jgi:hypothetical protein
LESLAAKKAAYNKAHPPKPIKMEKKVHELTQKEK